MMRSRILLVVMTAAVLLVGRGAGADEPSWACDAGEVPPVTTPAGVGVDVAGTPPGGTRVAVCNSGVAPAPGQVQIYASPLSTQAILVVDGDSSFRDLPCSDGYTGVMVDNSGATFFHGADGDYSTASPGVSPEAFATQLAACVPA